MARKKTYEVFVHDANGWDKECPSYQTAFFGHEKRQYLPPHEGGHSTAGSVLVEGRRDALILCGELNSTGDWMCPDGVIRRPWYALREYKPE